MTLRGVTGKRFTEAEAPASADDAPPIVTREQAIETAIRRSVATFAGALRPQVEMTARFGYFSDDHYAQIMPDGTRRPFYQHVPVWLITFFGPGVNRLPIGGHPPAGADLEQWERDLRSRAFHEENIVIDAATGECLMKYGFRCSPCRDQSGGLRFAREYPGEHLHARGFQIEERRVPGVGIEQR